MIVSNSSIDSKHMSTIVLSLGTCENHLDPNNYRIGKQLAPFGSTFIGANTIVWQNNDTNTALEPVTVPYQVNKFPVSGFASA